MKLLSSIAIAGALGATSLACGLVLGLNEPTLDTTLGDSGNSGDVNTMNDASTNDVVTPPGDAGSAPIQLFNARVRRIALDTDAIYYTEMFDFVVGRIGKDGTGQVALANGSAITGYFPNTITTDDTTVYWASVGGIYSCAKAGCANAPTAIIDENKTMNYGPGAIGVDATNVYFVNYDENNNSNSIMKVAKGAADGTVTTLVPTAKICVTINNMVLSGTYLYYTCDEGPVGRVTIADGTVEVLSAPGAPMGADRLAVAQTTLYYGEFVEQATMYQMPIMPEAGSTAIDLMQAYVNGIDVDTQYLYWADVGVTLDNGGGSIVRCSLSACSSSATTLTKNIDIPTDLKVDATNMYWAANGNGDTPNTGVWKMALP